MDSSELEEQTRQSQIMFLKTELETSFGFSELALSSEVDSDKRVRNTANARKGYDTILYSLENAKPEVPATVRQEIESELTRLRAVLKRLGEAV